MFRKAIILLMALVAISSTAVSDTVKPSIKEMYLGETKVELEVISSGRGPVFVVLHENEATAIATAKKLLPTSGGMLIILRHSGERNVKFMLKGQTYQFDPNRIFTPQGIKKTLRGGSAPEAAAAVRALAKIILVEIGRRPIVALHNNTNGNYSLVSYLPGSQYSSDAAEVHQVPTLDPDDFFFTTEESVFLEAKKDGFNVVLQSGVVTDDGSLSVYSLRRGQPYVNVEAEHGKKKVQLEMLTWLVQNLR
ncbi:protein tyrosine phosphatase [Patescibacteria group bacterium]|nr:protein tyrosine phosphatase [Patescibacteria group bacterium]